MRELKALSLGKGFLWGRGEGEVAFQGPQVIPHLCVPTARQFSHNSHSFFPLAKDWDQDMH